MTFLAAKKTYRYGDSIAYRCVSRMLARTPQPFVPTVRHLPAVLPPKHAVRSSHHAVRPPAARRPPATTA